jgi:hypothetical protein
MTNEETNTLFEALFDIRACVFEIRDWLGGLDEEEDEEADP